MQAGVFCKCFGKTSIKAREERFVLFFTFEFTNVFVYVILIQYLFKKVHMPYFYYNFYSKLTLS